LLLSDLLLQSQADLPRDAAKAEHEKMLSVLKAVLEQKVGAAA